MNKNYMYQALVKTINNLPIDQISDERLQLLKPLIDCIKAKWKNNETIHLNFICTHNSKRSHLSQLWAQVAANFYGINSVTTYSGGTEETALYPKIIEILVNQGFKVIKLSESENVVYSIKFADNVHPVIGFSKKYNHVFNPTSDFLAIMTCTHADENCPLLLGAKYRFSVPYKDPKLADLSYLQDEVYMERSIEIASEMFYVFSQIKK